VRDGVVDRFLKKYMHVHRSIERLGLGTGMRPVRLFIIRRRNGGEVRDQEAQITKPLD
jgi:hypothetical protein